VTGLGAAFVLGLVHAGHCAGMCGGFALMAAGGSSGRATKQRTVVRLVVVATGDGCLEPHSLPVAPTQRDKPVTDGAEGNCAGGLVEIHHVDPFPEGAERLRHGRDDLQPELTASIPLPRSIELHRHVEVARRRCSARDARAKDVGMLDLSSGGQGVVHRPRQALR